MNRGQIEKCAAHDIRHDCLMALAKAAEFTHDRERAESMAKKAIESFLYDLGEFDILDAWRRVPRL